MHRAFLQRMEEVFGAQHRAKPHDLRIRQRR
jgi:hypothetical protein